MTNPTLNEIPAIDETVIAALDAETAMEATTKTAALEALRVRYAPLARHAGFVQTEYDYAHESDTTDHYRGGDGTKVHAILAVDCFDRTTTDVGRGEQTGDRLYLLESGQWLRIERTGTWSAWSGASEGWSCGAIAKVTDEEVAAEYDLGEIVKELSKQLTIMATKLPARLSGVRARTEAARALLDAIAKG